jgi:glycolate oxidase iron-sulfur subunit
MMQIGNGTSVPIVHTVELLDWASGGPVPPALTNDLETQSKNPKLL